MNKHKVLYRVCNAPSPALSRIHSTIIIIMCLSFCSGSDNDEILLDMKGIGFVDGRVKWLETELISGDEGFQLAGMYSSIRECGVQRNYYGFVEICFIQDISINDGCNMRNMQERNRL